jgi:hypothetical protein
VDVCGLLEALGAGGKSGVIQVPKQLFAAPEEIVAAFLRGYFEGDGSAANGLSVRSVSKDMLEGVFHLLSLFGIPAHLELGPPDPRGYAPRHTLRILGDRSKLTFRDRIGFLSPGKRAKLDALITGNSHHSTGEMIRLRSQDDVLAAKDRVYAWYRAKGTDVPQGLYVFMSKLARGHKRHATLPRIEALVTILRDAGAPVPDFLEEVVDGQYLEASVVSVSTEPPAVMYDIAVDDEQYMAEGVVVHNSSGPNLQNIPVRTELGRRIRAAFVPEPGWKFVAADYSQIELRILAHVCGEESLVEAFRRGEDIHRRTAAEVFGVALEAVSKEQREVAKTTNFSVIYGVTAFGLSRGLSITSKEAQEYLNRFFASHQKVKAYLVQTVAEGRERGYVQTLFGRRRYLPELRSGNPNVRGFAERMATNAPIQGTAADLVKIAMLRMAEALAARKLRSRMLLQVHDELLFEAPAEEVDALSALATEVMEAAMVLEVPLKVDVATGGDWSQV